MKVYLTLIHVCFSSVDSFIITEFSDIARVLHSANTGFFLPTILLMFSFLTMRSFNIIYQVINLSTLSLTLTGAWMYLTGNNFIFIAYLLAFVGAVIMLFLGVVMMLPSSVIVSVSNSQNFSLLFFLIMAFFWFLAFDINNIFLIMYIIITVSILLFLLLNILFLQIHKNITGHFSIFNPYRLLLLHFYSGINYRRVFSPKPGIFSVFSFILWPYMVVLDEQEWPFLNTELMIRLTVSNILVNRRVPSIVMWHFYAFAPLYLIVENKQYMSQNNYEKQINSTLHIIYDSFSGRLSKVFFLSLIICFAIFFPSLKIFIKYFIKTFYKNWTLSNAITKKWYLVHESISQFILSAWLIVFFFYGSFLAQSPSPKLSKKINFSTKEGLDAINEILYDQFPLILIISVITLLVALVGAVVFVGKKNTKC